MQAAALGRALVSAAAAPRGTVRGMRIVIAGGHGQIALRLERLLAARGDEAVGLIRNRDHADDLREAGAKPVLCDLESASVEEVAAHLQGADAAVFAAGGGPSSGAARKDTVDRAAAQLFAEAAVGTGVRRFVVVSSMGADREPPEGTDPVFAAYLRAKGAADDYVRSLAGLDWTILRPGMLTDEPGTGLVDLAERTGRGPVPRDDVAAALAALLCEPGTAGRTLELISGSVPVEEAVKAAATG
jgi:nucleoside-diphosphate-sugar epimerase